MRFVSVAVARSFALGALLACSGAAFARSMSPPSPQSSDVPSGTRPLAAPIYASGAIYGTTSSGGPNCRTPFDDRAYDTGCGVLYRLDRDGTFTREVAFDGRPIRGALGALVAAPDGRLYGTTAPQSSTATVFRFSPTSRTVTVVHSFEREHQTFLFGLSVDRVGNAYVVGQDRRFFPLPPQNVYRIESGGATHQIHTFDGTVSAVGPPALGADGALYGSLTDTVTNVCAIYRLDARGRVYRDIRDTCRRADMPQSQLVGPIVGELYGLNATAIIAFTAIDRRRIVYRDTTPGERLVGAPVVRDDGSVDALAVFDGGAKCGKIVHISRDGAASTATTFARSEGRCWGNDSGLVYPRLAAAGDELALTTVAGPNCGVYRPAAPRDPEQDACGAVMIVRRDGTVAAVHDFSQYAPVSDGGSPTVRVGLTGSGRRLTVTFDRPKQGDDAHPFVVSPERVEVSLVDRRGYAHTLRAISNAAVRSRVGSETTVYVIGRAPGDELAAVDYRIDPSVASSMYAFRIRFRSGVRDAKGEPLGFDYASPTAVYVSDPKQTHASIDAIRHRFVGKRVYGYGGSVDVSCFGGDRDLELSVPSVVVAAVEGNAGAGRVLSYVREGLERYDNVTFIDLDPIRVRYSRVSPDVFSSQFAASSSPTGSERIAKDTRPPCLQPADDFAGSWDLERLLTTRSIDDHTEWSRSFRNAIGSGIPIVGMTPEMVAYMWGYPTIFGTARQMEALHHWIYDGGSGSERSVRFRHGHVASIELPSQPPPF